MSNDVTLIIDALEYFDNNNENNENNFKNTKYIKFESGKNDINHNKFYMYDKNKNEIYKYDYEILGLYNAMTHTWVWGWAIPHFEKKNITIITKLFNYGIDLDPKVRFLKTELITSRFRISNPVQLDIHSAIASYISKKPIIYKFYKYKDQIIDDNYLLDISKNDNNAKNYVIYYMFILDYTS